MLNIIGANMQSPKMRILDFCHYKGSLLLQLPLRNMDMFESIKFGYVDNFANPIRCNGKYHTLSLSQNRGKSVVTLKTGALAQLFLFFLSRLNTGKYNKT
jgi:hypothetical protein